MARKIFTKANPKLAVPHKAGDELVLVQPLAHVKYGVITAVVPQYWSLHITSAEERYRKLLELDKVLSGIEPDGSKSRFLGDEALIREMYEAGTEMVTHTVLAMQHLVLDIAKVSGAQINPEREDLATMMRSVLKNIGFPKDLSKDQGYSRFDELSTRLRNAIEHPNDLRTYNVKDPSTWDQVPMSWFLSSKALIAYEGSRKLFDEIYDFWQVKRKEYEKPEKLTVQRGIEFSLTRPKKIEQSS